MASKKVQTTGCALGKKIRLLERILEF